MAGSLSLSFLGSFQVEHSGKPVTHFESDKARALLAYLATEADYPHRRDSLVELLWPTLTPKAGRHNLSQALLNVRQAISDREADPPTILADRATVQFNSEAQFWSDVTEFEEHLAACEKHSHPNPGTCTICMENRQRAVGLYRGDFLRGLTVEAGASFDDWLTLKRESLQRRVVEALVLLARYHEDRLELDKAHYYAQRQVELEPWQETAYRQLMRVEAHLGQRSAALRQYEALKQMLSAELGVEPEDETKRLYRRILSSGGQTVRHNLPPQATTFLGRQEELAETALLLARPAGRLLTILGPGGVGKTRLALELAWRMIDRFLDGVYFVSLTGFSDSTALVSAVAESLDFRFHGNDSPLAQLLQYLRNKEVLLLLDGFEQLHKAAGVVNELLHFAPETKIMLTSRARLYFQEELVFELQGLPAPPSDSTMDPENFAAVQLFVERARQVDNAFTIENSDPIVDICRLVDGLPLAIELAASWVRFLSPEEIVSQIESDLGFLASPADMSATYRSMRAVFDRSWHLLSATEQAVFGLLSLFRGPFSRDAAAEVANASLQELARLVDQSLVHRRAADRYGLHELLRQYAAERLGQAAPEVVNDGQRRMVHYFLSFAVTHQGEYSVLEQQSANLLASMHLAHENEMWAEIMQFAAVLAEAWFIRARFTDARRGYEWVIEAAEQLDNRRRLSHALRQKARALIELGDYEEATALLAKSFQMSQDQDDEVGLASTLYYQGRIAIEEIHFDEAQRLLGESRRLFQRLGDQIGAAKTLYLEADVPFYQQEYDEAAELGRQALAIQQKAGDTLGCIRSLGLLADISLKQEDYSTGRNYCRQALALCDELHEQGERAAILYILSEALRNLADLTRAREMAEESLRLFAEMGDRMTVARVHWRLSHIDFDLGNHEAAINECLESNQLFAEMNYAWGQLFALSYLGDIYLAVGRPGRARQAWEEALDLGVGPEHPEYAAVQQRLESIDSHR